MKSAKTDELLSIRANEFVWNSSALSEAHTYLLPAVIDLLSKDDGRRVLDLGCGNGAVTNHLAQCGLEVAGIDGSETGIALARNSYPSIQFEHASFDAALPSSLATRFDAVIAVEVIEHLLLPRQLFERAREALKPNGKLIVTTPYHGYWKNLALALTGRFDEHWHPMRDFGHVKFFSARTLNNIFEEQGFAVRGVHRIGRLPPFAKSMIIHGVAVK